MTPIIEIIHADEQEIFRDGLAAILSSTPDVRLLASARNGKQLEMLVEKHAPDIVLTETRMQSESITDTIRNIGRKFPRTGIIILSAIDEEAVITDMIVAGARGYILKTAGGKEVIEAIRLVYRRQPYYCYAISTKIANIIKTNGSHNAASTPLRLSEKETEIIKLICLEYSNTDISKSLHLSPRTIEGYRERIRAKTNANSAVGIVLYAIRKGIFVP